MSTICISFSVFLILVGAITILVSLSRLHRNIRVLGLRATPIDRVRSGLVAVRGIVKKNRGIQLRTPIGGYPCVWYRTVLYRTRIKGTDNDIIFKKEKGGDISLSDDTGTIFIEGSKSKKFLSNSVSMAIGAVHGWPDGFREFVRNNKLPIDPSKISNNTFFLIQEYIQPLQEIKVIGYARGPKKVSDKAVRATVPYTMVHGGILSDLLMITNIHNGEKIQRERIMYTSFLVIGILSLFIGLWFLIFGL